MTVMRDVTRETPFGRPQLQARPASRAPLTLEAIADPELRRVIATVLEEDRGLIEFLADR
jgi:hypothetical protein